MSSLVGLKTDSWDLTKGKLETVDSWPMMASPGPIVIILAVYLLFVLRVGPAYMEKRAPYKLTNVLIGYNAVQVIFSIFLVAKYLMHVQQYGIVHAKCLMNERDTSKEVANGIWWYFIAKVTELLDTVFFVLRKKSSQVSFLHIYHHSVMMAGTWVFLKYGPTDHVIFLGLLNSLVHIIMYSYYGMAAMGPRLTKYLWWKKYLTTIQLIQFLTMLYILYEQSKVSQCPLPKGVYYFFTFTLCLFFYLFADYFRKEFIKNRSQRNAQKSNYVENTKNDYNKKNLHTEKKQKLNDKSKIRKLVQ